MLHILSNSPFKVDIYSMFEMLLPQDSVIALQDGTLISISKNFLLNELIKHSKNLYVLQEDVFARGISEYISHNFKLINYSDFVVLTEMHDKCINW
ncbi:sulfurtransferase complex subunit TusB [Buchnera aphidicola]|uniref:Sulfurtransferase complex subunit TusB n=1 Tax=Buchnera aphidicola (Sarucallis kahawaluokalani) TaxID=1241878 RepID=A0A4D6YJU3_9GAMM|nr:sulfurtransferase complex subunit TusB [Buchnera aphidicola]QCI26140.1 sulfurtransferase complex subunit TusB [Buchnera aphidicola (Sarucallis kahawaluokalani)]